MKAFRALSVGIMFMACSVAGLEVGLGSEIMVLPRKLMQDHGNGTSNSTLESFSAKKSSSKWSPPKKTPPKKSPPKNPPAKASPRKASPPKASPPKASPPKASPPKASPPKASPPKKSPPATPAPGGGCKAIIIEVGPGGLFVFKPDSATVPAGCQVTFSLKSMGHNVKFSKAPAGVDLNKISDVGMMAPDVSLPYTFKTTLSVRGDYEYGCTPHLGVGMIGKIKVT